MLDKRKLYIQAEAGSINSFTWHNVNIGSISLEKLPTVHSYFVSSVWA